MKLFYSTISQENQPQADPVLSLGGFCSSSPVPSGQLNSLFGNISQTTLERNRPQYICLILKNIFGFQISDAKLWIESNPSNQGKFRVAISGAFGKEFESVVGIYSKPLYAEFNTAEGVGDSIQLPVLVPSAQYAIWIERSINIEADEISKRNDPDYLYATVKNSLPTDETVGLKIEWSNVTP